MACEKCVWWKDMELVKRRLGKCRRYSPKTFRHLGSIVTEWPETKCDDDCGEFENKHMNDVWYSYEFNRDFPENVKGSE